MTPSYFIKKSQPNYKVESFSVKKNRSKSFSNLNIFSFRKNIKNFESSKFRFFPLFHTNNNGIDIKWKEGKKEIFVIGKCHFANIALSFKKSEKEFLKFKFYLSKYISLNKLSFNINEQIRINNLLRKLKKPTKIKEEERILKDEETQSLKTKESSTKSIRKSKINNIIIDFAFSKKNFCNYYPNKREMKELADKKPSHFPLECFHGVNSFHNHLGKKEFLDLNENSINYKNDSYKIIDRKDHILLNHFCQKINVNNNINYSITIKYRHKNTSFVYYK